MKKLFSFRSHSSNSLNNNQSSPPSTDKQVYWEKPIKKVENSAKSKNGSEDHTFVTPPSLRRSLSFSSRSFYDSGKDLRANSESTGSPYSASSHSKQCEHHSSRSRTLTPERQTRRKCVDESMVQNGQGMEKFECAGSRENSDFSEISSYNSSNVSNKVLDRYIDGEQQLEKYNSKTSSFSRYQFENGNAVVKRPPRFQCNVPVSYDVRQLKPRSQSFSEAKDMQLQLSSRNGDDNGHGIVSPGKLAKHVVERLSQSRFLHKMASKEFDHDGPITIEDVYGSTLNRCPKASTDEMSPRKYDMDCLHSVTTNGSDHGGISARFLEKDSIFGVDLVATTDNDIELLKQFKEAEERAAHISDELEKVDFLQFGGLDRPALVQTIWTLTEEKLNMALEVSASLEGRIADRALFKEKHKLGMSDLHAQCRRLEKEKNELQLALEKELDRRSTEWSLKLEKLQVEEQRLRERVRELAEQNVCLQRELSSYNERETNASTKITNLEKQVGDLSFLVNEATEKNRFLQKSLSELENRTRVAEEDRDCIRRNYSEKISECKDMHHAISRLQRTCNDQEKTIDGLRGLCEDIGRKISHEQFDFGFAKVQVEHIRLTGVEHALRKEVESCRAEVNSLRRENIDLLDRLKHSRKEGEFSTFKLDRELQNRVSFLQDQMISLLKESNKLGREFLGHVKPNNGITLKDGLDCQFLVEYEVKLHGLERAAENLTTSMQKISTVLHDKFMLQENCYPSGFEVEPQMPGMSDESAKRNEKKSEEILRSELKAEVLLTTLLREKLYTKELEMEQMQAELAAAVRGNNILKAEKQNTEEDLSCINHKSKELELQAMKKDETINQLQGDLQECKKELTIVRGILPKVTEERDLMWEEVKQLTEKNMLLSSDISMLKKKIEALDEDILLKDGQITILKDSITKPFDLLASPDSTDNFSWVS